MEAGDSVSVTFDWRRDEHARVAHFLFRDLQRTGKWQLFRWGGWVLNGIILGGLVLALLISPQDLTWILLPWLAIVVVWWSLQMGLGARLQARRVARLDPVTRAPITHVVDEDGFHVKGSGVTVDLTWDVIHRVQEIADFLLYYYTARHAYWTPKRAFPSRAQISRARGYIREGAGTKATLLDDEPIR